MRSTSLFKNIVRNMNKRWLSGRTNRVKNRCDCPGGVVAKTIVTVAADSSSSSIITRGYNSTVEEVMAYSDAACSAGRMTAFKNQFKRYKARKPPPDLSEVIDFTNLPASAGHDIVSERIPSGHIAGASELETHFGLTPVDRWVCHRFTDRPGLLVIPGVFSPEAQMHWAAKCLKKYACYPNVTNLDQHLSSEERGRPLWQNPSSLSKLRWLTLGYHYDWSAKVYTEMNRTDFPDDLKSMTKLVAKCVGYHMFEPETAIVNFYPPNATLSGHVDRSEWNLSSPLFSFSFGQTAVYLSGGVSLDETPVALYLRGGDMLVMAGEQRLVYHGVPKVIKGADFTNCTALGYDEAIMQYMNSNRMNITVRQVN